MGSHGSTGPGVVPDRRRKEIGVSDAPVSVLCVDDDPGVLELTATCLEHASDRLDVTTETTVADGLDRVADSDVDCVVSDYEMPGTDGLAFLESVRSVRPDLPFVLFTGKGNEEVASEAVSTGVTDYIRKDGRNQYALLANRIENAVDRWRAERELARRSRAIDVVSDGVAILDDEGRYVEVNDAYAADYGLAPEAIGGRHWTAMAPSEEATRLREEALSAMRREGRWSGTAVGRRDDGSTFTRRLTLIGLDEGHLRITSSPGDDAGGAVERSADAVDARGATGRRGRERERTSLAGSAGTAWAAVDADRATLTIAADRSLRADPSRLRRVLELLFETAIEGGSTGLDSAADGGEEPTVRIEVGATDDGFYVAAAGPGVAERERPFECDGSTDPGDTTVGTVARARGWAVTASGSDAGGVRFEVATVDDPEGGESVP
jgi:PAS domain S-box-containing protein